MDTNFWGFILLIRRLMESYQKSKNLYMVFIDLEKTKNTIYEIIIINNLIVKLCKNNTC